VKENLKIEPGIYLNLFPVDIPENPIDLIVVERNLYPDLKKLRSELKNSTKVYADGDKVYGYGADVIKLKEKGFKETKISLYKVPRLTGRMILEGFINKVMSDNYEVIEKKGRCKIFNWNEFKITRDNNVKVFKGFDIRSIFILDSQENKLVFGLIVDVVYTFKDNLNQPLNTYLISNNFGSQTLLEVRQIQGELIPTGKINTEIARQRLLENILPFIKTYSDFDLPCGLKATLSTEPTRVIIGGNIL
jgi:hypothetical protein